MRVVTSGPGGIELMTEDISLTGLVIALLLPWIMGCIWMHRLFTHSNQPCNWAVVIGVGYFVGLFFTTLVIRLWDAVNLELNFWYISCLLVALCVAGLAMRGNSDPPVLNTQSTVGQPHWQTAVITVLIALMIWRQVTLIQELLIRPMWGWDTWMNWAPKAITWWHSGTLVDFTRPEQWLSQPEDASSHTLGNYAASTYPPTVPLILLWSMMGAGTWDHTLLYLPWMLVSVNLGLALFGHLKLAGSTTIMAVVASYFLLNMPFLNVHSMVAGYADIWLGATFGLAVFALHEWHKCRHWSWGLLCVFFGLMCSQLKIPGLVLSAIILLVAFRSWLNLAWKTELAVFAFLLCVIAGIIFFGFEVDLPYLGNLSVSRTNITTSLFGTFNLEYHPVSEALMQSLLSSINWNILWYLFLAVLLLKIYSRAFLMPASNELIAFVMVIVFISLVFYFTGNYESAMNHMQLSRALIYPMPALTFYIFLGLISKKVWATDKRPALQELP